MDYTRTPKETPKTTTMVQLAPPGVAQRVAEAAAVNELTKERERI